MTEEPTLATNYISLLTDYLSLRGYDLSQVLHALEISERGLDEAQRRIPVRAFNRALEVACEMTSDPFLGLHIGERIRPAHLSVLGYLLMSCTSPRVAFQLHQRWHQRFTGGEVAEYVYEHDRIWLFWRMPPVPGYISRPAVETSLASSLTFARWLFGVNANPVAVQFPYAAPDDLSEYDRLFGCDMIFDAQCSGLCLGASVLETALPQGDPELHALMQAKAQRIAAEMDLTQDEPIGRVRREIMAGLSQAVPDLENTACRLNISSHTLKRRLAEQNTNFRRELDEVRRRLALGYLKDPKLSLTEITYLLNFSEPSAFHRAFKRWTGESPRSYREKDY